MVSVAWGNREAGVAPSMIGAGRMKPRPGATRVAGKHFGAVSPRPLERCRTGSLVSFGSWDFRVQWRDTTKSGEDEQSGAARVRGAEPSVVLPPLAPEWLAEAQKQEPEPAPPARKEEQQEEPAPARVLELSKTSAPVTATGRVDGVQKRGKILLSSPDIIDQEEQLAACGVLGRVFAPSVSRSVVEDGVAKACGQKPVGVSMFSQGKFLVILHDRAEAQSLLTMELRVAGGPVRLLQWSVDTSRGTRGIQYEILCIQFIFHVPNLQYVQTV